MTVQKKKFLMAYISVSKMLLEGSFLKRKFLLRKYLMDYYKGKFDGLHKQLKNDFGKNYRKRTFPKKEIICQKFRKNAGKILKKYWKNTHWPRKCPKMQKNPQNIQINCFAGWKIWEKFQRNYKKFQNIYTYFIKISLIFFIH